MNINKFQGKDTSGSKENAFDFPDKNYIPVATIHKTSTSGMLCVMINTPWSNY